MSDHVWFINKDEPEEGYADVYDALDNYVSGEIVELAECRVSRTIFAVWIWGADGEREIKNFDSAEAAEAWVKERKAAADEAAKAVQSAVAEGDAGPCA